LRWPMQLLSVARSRSLEHVLRGLHSPSSPPPPLLLFSSSLTQDITSSPHTHAPPASPGPLSLGLAYARAAWPGGAVQMPVPFAQLASKRGRRREIDGSASSPLSFFMPLEPELGAIPTHARAPHHHSHPLRHQLVPVPCLWVVVRGLGKPNPALLHPSHHQPLPGWMESTPPTGAPRSPPPRILPPHAHTRPL